MTVKENLLPPGALDPEVEADFSRRAARLKPLHRSEIRPINRSEWLCRGFFFGEDESEGMVISDSASKGIFASEARYYPEPDSEEPTRETRRLKPEESSVFQDLLERNSPSQIDCAPGVGKPPFMIVEHIRPGAYACLVSGRPQIGCPEHEIARALCAFWPEGAKRFLERL